MYQVLLDEPLVNKYILALMLNTLFFPLTLEKMFNIRRSLLLQFMSSSYPYLIQPNNKKYFYIHRSWLEKVDCKPYTKSKILKVKDVSKKQVLVNSSWSDLMEVFKEHEFFPHMSIICQQDSQISIKETADIFFKVIYKCSTFWYFKYEKNFV